jgi:uncharacterized Fe-S cluster protein YjdI
LESSIGRCIHTTACLRGLATVFDVQAKPFVQPDHARTASLAKVVHRCSIDALICTRPDGCAVGLEEDVVAALIATDGLDEPLRPHCLQRRQQRPPCRADAGRAVPRELSKSKPFCDETRKVASSAARHE